jgi:hypothetical protein
MHPVSTQTHRCKRGVALESFVDLDFSDLDVPTPIDFKTLDSHFDEVRKISSTTSFD